MVLEAATELVESVRIIIAHSREAGVDRDRAEQQSDQMREYIVSRIAGEQATEPHMDGFESTQAMVQSAHARERAFLRSFHALMVLWSVADVRDLAEDAFRALEESRLVASEPLIPNLDDLVEPDEGRLNLDRMKLLMSAMGDRIDGRRQRWDDLARKENDLLERAQETALAILAKVQSIN